MDQSVYEAMHNQQQQPATPTQPVAPTEPTQPAAPVDNSMTVMSQEKPQKRLDIIDTPETQTQTGAPGAQTPQQPSAGSPFNEEAFFSEKSAGKFKSWDEIQAAITKQPEVVKETIPPTFANDTSKQVYELLAAGKMDDVLPILQRKSFAGSVKDMADDDVIIAHIRAQYPSLNESGARRQFERMYGIDEDKFEGADLDIEKAIVGDKKKIDAQNARTYFAKSVEELQFPTIETAKPQEPQMSDAAKQVMQFGQGFVKPDTSVFPFEFAPENSPIKVKGQTSPSAEKVQKISEQLGNDPEAFIAGFISTHWMKDGKFNKEAIARDFAFFEEAPNLFNDVASKTANEFLKQKIAADKNIIINGGGVTGGIPVEVGNDEQSALEKFFHIPPEKKTA